MDNAVNDDTRRDLVKACFKPGASVVKLIGECGVNANLVHIWIGLYWKARSRVQAPSSKPADIGMLGIPVMAAAAA
jgi:transposase-like protein